MGLFGFFGKKEAEESTSPANDRERWIIGTYAMWSEATNGNWRYIAGSTEKNKKEAASMRVMLRNDWGVTDKNSLVEMVQDLIFLYRGECAKEEVEQAAWDLCRACQILGMGYVGGWIEREEMMKTAVDVGCLMQKHFHSWAELYDSYLKGYANWRKEQGENAEEAIQARADVCLKLRNMPDGPCSVDWNLTLGTGVAEEKKAERVFEIVKPQDRFTLENQNGVIRNFRDIDIEDYLENMFLSPDQFVILTSPKARNKVRYVQACMQKENVEVELGIEENGTHLVYKLCSREECIRIFLDFFDNNFIPDLEEYQPVQSKN